MKARRAVLLAAVVVVAVALQTTLFVRLRPFDAAPALVVLVVMAYARYLPAEYALLTGFGAGSSRTCSPRPRSGSGRW